MKFGMSAVTASVKRSAITDEAVIIANSTRAKFTLSSLVTRQLGLLPGDNVQFVSNIEAIQIAITEGDAGLVEWLAEYNESNGTTLEFGSIEASDLIIAQFGEWAICKAVEAKDKLGNVRMTSGRVSKEDRAKLLEVQRDELTVSLANELQERAIKAGLAEAGEDVESEILASMLTPEDVVLPTSPAFLGSKLATTSSMAGLGLPLNFSDGGVWDTLKKDLGETAESKNRYFDVNLNEPLEAPIYNGFETVTVKAYTFKFSCDKVVVSRKKADNASNGADEDFED